MINSPGDALMLIGTIVVIVILIVLAVRYGDL
jgi:hypothetical protein